MRLAVLADVHGNLAALEAVLEELAADPVELTVNLGDCLYGPLDPAATARRLRALALPTVSGNQDRALVEAARDPAAANPAAVAQVEALRPDDIAWLAALPAILSLEGQVLLCHGTPRHDATYLLEEVSPHGVSVRSEAELRRELADVREPVVLCGHSHVPRTVAVAGGPLVINPGSVGLPAYTDDAPHPHAMAAGSPHARYCLLERRRSGWRVEHRAVPYDWATASRRAAEAGRDDWARWLLSGRG